MKIATDLRGFFDLCESVADLFWVSKIVAANSFVTFVPFMV